MMFIPLPILCILRIIIILFLKLKDIKKLALYFPEKGCHLGTNRSDNET